MEKKTNNIFEFIAKNATGFTYFGLCDKKKLFCYPKKQQKPSAFATKWK
jgi:hypothetical protein